MPDPVEAFLADAGWAGARRSAIAGDLSARRYARLTLGTETAVLMDAAGDVTSTAAFVKIARWLLGTGLSAPRILAESAELGLLLLEDLGSLPVSRILEDNPGRMTGMFGDCLELLLHIRHGPPPAGLRRPGAAELAAWTTLADEHYPGVSPGQLDPFRSVLETVIGAEADPPAVSLRDFHADNLMWLAGRQGFRRFGLLDFQDAFLAHPVYDLVSLLTDARIDVPGPVREATISRYAHLSGDDPDVLTRAFSAYSAQRNLRILGIFARAATRDGKRHHIAKLPRVHGYLAEALAHPVFARVRDGVLVALAPPDMAMRALAR